ncbi:M15 family peptidase, partial [Xenorhabdus sp. XENO-1]|nr:M15 family peptidase [Xenorhabdus bovienii subsp. africana]
MTTNNFKFSQRSENNLKGVHPDLVAVVRRALALSPVDFTVIEGLRTLERQKQ